MGLIAHCILSIDFGKCSFVFSIHFFGGRNGWAISSTIYKAYLNIRGLIDPGTIYLVFCVDKLQPPFFGNVTRLENKIFLGNFSGNMNFTYLLTFMICRLQIVNTFTSFCIKCSLNLPNYKLGR